MAGFFRDQDWRSAFRGTLERQETAGLHALLDEYEAAMGAVSVPSPGEDPLRVAVADLSPWGVQEILRRRHQKMGPSPAWNNFPPVLRSFFDRSRLAMKVPVDTKLGVWEALLPALLGSVGARQHALAYYLQALNDARPFPDGMTWKSLQMDRVGEGLWALGYHLECPEETMTPLQRAWRSGAFEAMERLLDHGVSATEPDPASLLPDWTLKATVESMAPGTVGPEWAGILRRLRALELDTRLPLVQHSKPSLRF